MADRYTIHDMQRDVARMARALGNKHLPGCLQCELNLNLRHKKAWPITRDSAATTETDDDERENDSS